MPSPVACCIHFSAHGKVEVLCHGLGKASVLIFDLFMILLCSMYKVNLNDDFFCSPQFNLNSLLSNCVSSARVEAVNYLLFTPMHVHEFMLM